ncbi:unnamed protein product [Pelagomonas calceolata]|uniref:Uncharacterized protein n=1 Tax=Pelagomonas calceolata TaxID=35677 RepID=A0A7S3ZPJ2_9STRA|nr:unnamed protein product [Pelagomonas calceolata]|mmetsp:Transcript_10167/g.29866  ORF Transcript_10167/g.29866 Transcript_10167/m.29866 type:complete len:202 (+) Transcript_10167:216-821(+)
MATLQRPALRRTAATQPIRASFFDDSNDARNSPEAQQLREQITTVYTNTPFRGPAFQLPSGAVVVEDMWLASLNTTIDEILDSGLDGLKTFANVENRKHGWVGKWLKHKVGLEGNDLQKMQYKALENDIWPDTVTPPMPIVPEPQPVICRGLPADLMDFQHQPLREVEVYRDLGGFEMPEEAKPEGEEDEEKKADDMAEGA